MIRWTQPISCLVVALILPANALARAPTHVACVGDSITRGVGASTVDLAYPSVLQAKLGSGVQVGNFGVAGATMLSNGDKPYEMEYQYELANKFVSGAGPNAVVDVVIMFGANDSKPYNWTPTGKPKQDLQFIADYRAMIDKFTAMPTKPAIYVMLPTAVGTGPCCDIDGTVLHDEVRPAILQVASLYNLPVVDNYATFDGHPELLTSDSVHPNDAGNAALALNVFTALGAPIPVQATPDPSAPQASAGAGGASGGTSAPGGTTASVPVAMAGTGGVADAGVSGAPSGGASGMVAASVASASPGSSGSCSYSAVAVGNPAWLALVAVAGAASLRRRRRNPIAA